MKSLIYIVLFSLTDMEVMVGFTFLIAETALTDTPPSAILVLQHSMTLADHIRSTDANLTDIYQVIYLFHIFRPVCIHNCSRLQSRLGTWTLGSWICTCISNFILL